MSLVEASHYSDEDGLREQVGQYSPPPQVRLQRGGLGKLLLSFVAAAGSGAALYFAVSLGPALEPLTSVDGETVLPGSGPTASATSSPQTSDFAVAPVAGENAGDVVVANQLALLAGATLLPEPEPHFIDLNGDAQSTAEAVQVAGQLQGTEPSEPEFVIARRIPLPHRKPDTSLAAPADSEPQHQPEKLASVVAPEPAPQTLAPPPPAEPVKPALQTAVATLEAEAVTPAVHDKAADGYALNAAPWSRITQRSTNGLLPVIGPNGETSREYYARPFPAGEKRPRISIVIGGLGLSSKATIAAIDKLPPEVTLAFAPYGKNLQAWIDRARARGHEVLLELPMEPFDYPANDPGPFTLLTNNDGEQNTRRLNWLLAQFNGYVGVTNYLGAKFTSNPEVLLPVLRQLDERGLLVLDDGTSNRSQVASLSARLRVPHETAARTLDLRVSRASVDDALAGLEDVTRRKGSAIGMGYAYPVTIDRILQWASTLERKGFVLAPVSANVQTFASDESFDPHANSY